MSNSHIIALFIAGTLLLVLFAIFMIAFLVIQKQKQNTYLLEKQKTEFDHQNDILKTRIEVQESAMHEIAKEVHDNIKSKLATIHVNVKRLKSLDNKTIQDQLLNNTIELVENTIQESRNISHGLNTEFIKKKGLAWLLKNEMEYIGLSQSIECIFELKGEETVLDPTRSLQVYRIAQEALQNITKHAKASKIKIILDHTEANKMTMTVHDNGVGFDADKILSFSNGEGLVNMRQRAEVLDADLEIESAPSAGSSVSLTLNITNGRESANKDSTG